MDFLIIDDDKAFRDATRFLIEDEAHYAEVVASGAAGIVRLKESRFDSVILDLNLEQENGLDVLVELLRSHPHLPVVISTAQGSVKSAVEAMQRGAVDFLEKPFTRAQLHLVLARLKCFHQMDRNLLRLEREVIETRSENPELIFDFTSPGMRAVMEILFRAAPTAASILLQGESGTGKSAVARAIHQRSHIADQPFVTVSCPSLSKELLESELFGHVKGAFTGAVKDHWGKVKAADAGTLFLDEIGDLPLEIQPKLLRLLQEREFERLGENVTRQANVRVIAATNRDLQRQVTEGKFREDLYFRLNVIAVEIPPLRKRPEDLLSFAQHYLRHFAAQCSRPVNAFGEDAIGWMQTHSWPGNLRELRNTIERAVILARDNGITLQDLPVQTAPKTAQASPGSAAVAVGAPISVEALEEAHIRKVLEWASNLSEAAQVLGIDQATLYRRRKKLGLG